MTTNLTLGTLLNFSEKAGKSDLEGKHQKDVTTL